MSFLEIANSPYMYLICGGTVLLVTVILVYFLAVAWKRGLELGLTKHEMGNTIKTTLLVSLGPALSILIPMLALIKVLGAPWSWLRLSVIGSAAMELLLANMGLTNTGYPELGMGELPGEAWGIVSLCVGFGVLTGLVLNIFFNKKYSSGVQTMRQRDARKTAMFSNALFGGVIASLGTMNFVGSTINTAEYFTAAALMAVLTILIKKTGKQKLKEYAFALAIFLSMAAAILWANILG